jgi:hypothetical protein
VTHRKATLTSTVTLATLAGLAAVALLAVAWGGGSSKGEPERFSGPELADALAVGAGAEVQQVLADGVVTPGEFQATFERTARCMEAKGIVVVRPTGGASIDDGMVTEFPAGTDHDALTKEMAACIERHSSAIGRVWAEQERPTPQDIEQMLADVEACLAQRGRPELNGLSVFAALEKYGPGSPEADLLRECWHRAQERR